jgi:hypothetical protein
MTARDHSKLLGIFFMIQGGLQLFAGVLVGLIYGGMGVMFLSTARRAEEQTMGGIFLVMSVVIGLLILALAAFDFLTGWKLHKQKSSARTLGIIASCLSLLSFPLGTALGIYGLWFFFGDAGKNYNYGNETAGNNFSSPPPPQSWQ